MLPIKIHIAPCYGDDVEVVEFFYETIELSDDTYKHSARLITNQHANDDPEHLRDKIEKRYHLNWRIRRETISQVNICFRNRDKHYELSVFTGNSADACSYCFFKNYAEAKRVSDLIWNWVMKVEQEVNPESL